MDLHQIDHVGAEVAQALIDLGRGGLARAAVDLGHQEGALAVAVAQRVAHPDVAAAVVVVPAVVHEGHAVIDRGADDADGGLFVPGLADVEAAQARAARPRRPSAPACASASCPRAACRRSAPAGPPRHANPAAAPPRPHLKNRRRPGSPWGRSWLSIGRASTEAEPRSGASEHRSGTERCQGGSRCPRLAFRSGKPRVSSGWPPSVAAAGCAGVAPGSTTGKGGSPAAGGGGGTSAGGGAGGGSAGVDAAPTAPSSRSTRAPTAAVHAGRHLHARRTGATAA